MLIPLQLPYLNQLPSIEKGVFIAPNATLIGSATMKEDSALYFGSVIRADIAPITVGKRSNVQDLSCLHVATNRGVEIGDDVSIGHQCMIHACTIGDGCLIGMSSIIMDDTIIGKNCIVGAGSLLPKNKTYPDGYLILGRPAKALRPLTTEEIESIYKLAQKYVGVKNNYLGII